MSSGRGFIGGAGTSVDCVDGDGTGEGELNDFVMFPPLALPLVPLPLLIVSLGFS